MKYAIKRLNTRIAPGVTRVVLAFPRVPRASAKGNNKRLSYFRSTGLHLGSLLAADQKMRQGKNPVSFFDKSGQKEMQYYGAASKSEILFRISGLTFLRMKRPYKNRGRVSRIVVRAFSKE